MFDFAVFNDAGRLRFDETFTFWAGLIGGAFLSLGTHGTDQMFVQRALAARSQADAGKALILSGVVVFVQFALFLAVGIALASFYTENPPAQAFDKTDRVFANYIVHEMPAGIGLIGLLLAAVFSAAMSTLSSSLNSSATAVVTDWIVPTNPSLNDQDIVRLSKRFTILFGIIQIAIGIWAADWNDSVVKNALAIAGFSAGLLLGLFALGTFLRRVDQDAALRGLVGGLLVLLAVKFGPSLFPEESSWRYSVAWPWFPVIGSCATFAIGWIRSYERGSRKI